jgi:hypothetical protein
MGDVVQGAFGSSYGSSGLGQTEVSVPPAEQEPARETGGKAVAPAEVARNLEMLLSDVRTAANRLINLPPAGVVPEELKTRLLARYAELESRARAIADKAGVSFDAVVIDLVHALQNDAVAFITEVEDTLRRVGVPGLELTTKPKRNWMLYGVIAVGLGVAGFAGYQAYKHNRKSLPATKRPVRRSSGSSRRSVSEG